MKGIYNKRGGCPNCPPIKKNEQTCNLLAKYLYKYKNEKLNYII